MLYVPEGLVASARRMSEFEELLKRFKLQREAAQETLRRIDHVINLLEQAKAALGADGLDALVKNLPPAPMIFKTSQRTRGILPPSDIAATVKRILSDNGHPMKRSELVAKLEARGIPVAGKDKNKNLGTILWRHSAEFVHLEKLGYWLKGVPLPGVYEPKE